MLQEAAEADGLLGQMILVGFPGDDERDRGVMAALNKIAQGVIGGVVLYPSNIRSARQLRFLTAFLANANSKLVPLIAVDQEGGLVQRLTRRKGYAYFASARNVGRSEAPNPRCRASPLWAHGGGACAGGGQSQFRAGGGSQLLSRQSGHRAAQAKLRRRPKGRGGARARLHHHPPRGQCRYRGQALSRPWLKPQRQPQGARRHLAELARERA